MLTRDEELGSRGTIHIRMLIPRGIAGITEDDRATLQAWLELVDWTGLDDDVFYLFLQKQKIGAELHIYLGEGTYHKRLFRGPNTNDMKK
jgi:hypothetical protein